MDHKGWHSRGYLPHFDAADTVQFVTFRLFDSLPRAVAETLAKEPNSLAKTNESLDRGFGACWLNEPAIATMVERALLHFDGTRYRMIAWCVMPNHVHAIVESPIQNQLGNIVHSWKSFSANRANRTLGRSGSFWHEDYFDRFIRDESHLARTIE
jgi:hypothetical protein